MSGFGSIEHPFNIGKTQSIDSPHVGALSIQSSCYGLAIPIVYGQTRITGNLLWYGDFVAVEHKTTQGGKGGGGVETKNYTYQTSFALGLCEGPIAGIRDVWASKSHYTVKELAGYTAKAVDEAHVVKNRKVTVNHADTFIRNGRVTTGMFGVSNYSVRAGVYTFSSTMEGRTVYISYTYWVPPRLQSALEQLGLTLFPGTVDQQPWSYLTTKHPSEALNYPNLTYVAAAASNLGSSPSLPNYSFEIQGLRQFGAGIVDAEPSEILGDVLTNARYGLGFSSERIAPLTPYRQYCVASDLFLSPALTEQATAQQLITDVLNMTNSAAVWSNGQLKIIPYGDQTLSKNGETYTPNVTPVYALTDDDFLVDGDEDPVTVERKPIADTYNQVQIEYFDRSNAYNIAVAEVKDQNNIEVYGVRAGSVIAAHSVCTADRAKNVAQSMLQRSLYILNTYSFRLGWKYALLEPMDIVTLTDPGLGLHNTPVRITQIDEDEFGKLTVTAEDFLAGVSSTVQYPAATGLGYSINYNSDPGNVTAVVMFEPPDRLTSTGLEVWLGVAGGANWGGSDVWVSLDDYTYQNIGTINGPARTGALVAPLAAGADPDEINTLSVALDAGSIIAGTRLDADTYATLCYVDGELLSFADATLIGQGTYELGYLRRGAYGSPITAHEPGTKFLRLDNAVFTYPYNVPMIGQTIYFKFTSFNIFQGGYQQLGEVNAYQYTLTGAAINSPLPDVTGLTANYVAGLTNLYWDQVSDFRDIDYEVRAGRTWETATLLGRTPLASYPFAGDRTYWVAAHYYSPKGVHVYSVNPASITVSGGILTANVVALFDEVATGFLGTVSGSAIVENGTLSLDRGVDMATVPDVTAIGDVVSDNVIGPYGTYQIPESHRVNIGRVAACNVMITTNWIGVNPFGDILSEPDVLSLADYLDVHSGDKVNVVAQIRTAQSDGVFGEWQNYVPGAYSAQYFDSRILLYSYDSQITPHVIAYTFAVDVPDRIEKGTGVWVDSGATTTITYTSPFNVTPNVQITVVEAQPGDDVYLTASTASGFQVRIVNGGVNVGRTINWISQGY